MRFASHLGKSEPRSDATDAEKREPQQSMGLRQRSSIGCYASRGSSCAGIPDTMPHAPFRQALLERFQAGVAPLSTAWGAFRSAPAPQLVFQCGMLRV